MWRGGGWGGVYFRSGLRVDHFRTFPSPVHHPLPSIVLHLSAGQGEVEIERQPGNRRGVYRRAGLGEWVR